MIILLMGVSGSGKTTIGQKLSDLLKLPFYDADDFHPPENVRKMKGGIPLEDADRQPWLETLSRQIEKWEREEGAILACSALKEKYRMLLQGSTMVDWVFLKGSPALIAERLHQRQGHYMPPELLASQFEALEIPAYGMHISIQQTPDQIIQEIMDKLKKKKQLSAFGIIGMGVMGKSLALNLADHQVKLSIYNRHVEGKEEKVAQKVLEEHPELKEVQAFDKLDELVESLEKPRKILLMIPAGQAIDQLIARLSSLMDKGDVLIDGGNSYYKDSTRRARYLENEGILYVPMGVSGGEDGAKKGPSLMPGGSEEGFRLAEPFLKKIAAKDHKGQACMHYVGPEGAGHFVKMVHNSIEYGEMQVLAELYGLMRYGLNLSPEEIVKTWKKWSSSGSGSYLLDISMDILGYKENGTLLLDLILDQAEQKGTGGWAVSTASQYRVPYAPLTAAVTSRVISSLKDKRERLAKMYPRQYVAVDREVLMKVLQGAYDMARLITHEIGFNLINTVSQKEKWHLNLSEIAHTWTHGCIIRSAMMEKLVEVFKKNDSLLESPLLSKDLTGKSADLAEAVSVGLKMGMGMPVMSSAINFFYSMTTANSTANLIQAQRDYFGAHTYRRTDSPVDQYFHTAWNKSENG